MEGLEEGDGDEEGPGDDDCSCADRETTTDLEVATGGQRVLEEGGRVGALETQAPVEGSATSSDDGRRLSLEAVVDAGEGEGAVWRQVFM